MLVSPFSDYITAISDWYLNKVTTYFRYNLLTNIALQYQDNLSSY